MRLTKRVRQEVLNRNEGYRVEESYIGKNYKQVNTYFVKGGRLLIISKAKVSWSDKKIVSRHLANDEQEKKFIKKYLKGV